MITPRDAEHDAQLALEGHWQALEDAGDAPCTYELFVREEVISGASGSQLEQWQASLDRLVDAGWTITRREDVARLGFWLTLRPPAVH